MSKSSPRSPAYRSPPQNLYQNPVGPLHPHQRSSEHHSQHSSVRYHQPRLLKHHRQHSSVRHHQSHLLSLSIQPESLLHHYDQPLALQVRLPLLLRRTKIRSLLPLNASPAASLQSSEHTISRRQGRNANEYSTVRRLPRTATCHPRHPHIHERQVPRR